MSAPTAAERNARRHVPVWLDGVRLPAFPRLTRSLPVDVCVVGAGFAGLTAALLLSRQGRDVVLLEEGGIASGESGRTTAHLTAALDVGYARLELLHGEKAARLAAESHVAAIARVEAIVREEGIACDFARVDGYLFAARPEHLAALERERAAAERAGLDEVTLVPRAPAGSWDTGPALRFPGQARLHPVRYLAGLARAFVKAGGRLFCGSRAEEVAGGSPARVTVRGGGDVLAESVVVATGAPASDRLRLPTRQSAWRTYVVGLPVARRAFGPELLWDTDDPPHYVRAARSGRRELLLVGGEDHRTGRADDEEERFARLERWARARFAVARGPVRRWSGQVMEPFDGLAYIGPDPEDVTGTLYVATGHSGNGTTYGTIAGMVLADQLEGRRSPWGSLYDPSRHSLLAAGRWARENWSALEEYASWVTGGDVEDAASLAPGEGGVVRRGLAKVAAYRDERGALHERSAVCAHLGCLVRWNRAERSWDCPCHGSRFDALGRVLNGPAAAGLDTV